MNKYAVFFTVLILVGCAGTSAKRGASWVSHKLATMSVEEKVGQMMVPAYVPRFFNEQDPQLKRLLRLVRQYHVGGVMFFKGAPYEVGRSIDRLQQAAETPLLVMADIEWGLQMRVAQGTRFPQNMAIGATGREDYAYEIGKITALEARSIGVHIGFAPVLDVNSNPDNVIINTRSYGEDPQLVAKLGSAFIRGLQENGVYATAKHFPGHGDTDVDSHLSLPTVDASRERIQRVELPPFESAVKAGVKCVMVGHIAFSEIPEMQGRPATLDRYFIQEILRKKMGFDGLVFTDAMDMGGITENYWSGQAAVMAINAGVDMVLMPPNFKSTYDFVVQAVKAGRIPMQRIDESVRRILNAKADLGLEQKPVFSPKHLESVLADPQFAIKAEHMANAAVTLVRDTRQAVPLHSEDLDSVLVVTITDEVETAWRGTPMNREVMKRIPNVATAFVDPRSTAKEIAELSARADSVDAIIVGVFVNWSDHKGTIALPDTTVKLLHAFFTVDKPMEVISFGSPYVLRQIPEVPSYLCVYESAPLAASAAIRAVFGEIPIGAKLPVSIPGFYRVGDGLQRSALQMALVKQIDDNLLKGAYAVLQKAIADSVFPGAQVAVVRNGKLIASRGFGHLTYDPASPEVTTSTIYDLASVTKVAATTVTAMRLWEQKKILLDIPVSNYLPKYHGGAKDKVTLRYLLTHSSGTHWWVDLWNKAKNPEEAYDYIYQLPLDYTPGDTMIYSDLGIIMVGKVLETVTGTPLDLLTAKMIYKPMGMNNTRFNPPKAWYARIAPTEIGGGMKRGLIRGEVHDENAYFLGGVSAHAGLFSTAEDLAALAQMLINGGIYRHQRFFSPATIKYWTTRQHIPAWSDRALGWDTPSDENSSAGDYFSPGSFGHLGFTGTSIWVDPNRKIAIVLLTNRVYPTRTRGGMHQVRRDFHQAAMKALLSDMGEKLPEEEVE
ncbi:MAG: glycoside hydrolase family 3 N-terminal domain-containing protein [bacterium]